MRIIVDQEIAESVLQILYLSEIDNHNRLHERIALGFRHSAGTMAKRIVKHARIVNRYEAAIFRHVKVADCFYDE